MDYENYRLVMIDLGDDAVVLRMDYEKHRLVTKFLEGHDLVRIDYK